MTPIAVRYKDMMSPTGYTDGWMFALSGSDAIVSPRPGGHLIAVHFSKVRVEDIQ